MKIIIKGEASVVDAITGKKIRGQKLEGFNDISDEAIFSEYFHYRDRYSDGEQSLIDAGVKGGKLVFVYDKKKRKLFSTTAYDTPRKLTKAEEKALVSYTQGQCSDGIGEGYEQTEVEGAYISAWHNSQKAKVEYSQEDV